MRNIEQNYKEIVATGYDNCAESYLESRRGFHHPEIELLKSNLSKGSTVLDIGCGPGIPVALELSDKFDVTGIDISTEQIKLASANVPNAKFVYGDIMSASFGDSSFDAIVSFYAIFHIRRDEQGKLFQNIFNWLKPNGYILCTLSDTSDDSYIENDFFGTRMFWSNFDLETYESMLTKIGFTILKTYESNSGYKDETLPEETHPIIFAQKKLPNCST